MLILKSFERWLQENFNSKLHIEKIKTRYLDKETNKEIVMENPDIDVLYFGNKKLCSVPKGLKNSKGWTNLNDVRGDRGYQTSDHIAHRSLNGIGLVLLGRKIIDSRQFVRCFTTKRNWEMLMRMKIKRD